MDKGEPHTKLVRVILEGKVEEEMVRMRLAAFLSVLVRAEHGVSANMKG